MKKLLVGLLALGSISAFASYEVNEQDYLKLPIEHIRLLLLKSNIGHCKVSAYANGVYQFPQYLTTASKKVQIAGNKKGSDGNFYDGDLTDYEVNKLIRDTLKDQDCF
jgi:hypothetical protein